MTLEELLEIKPDHAGGPVRLKPGQHYPAASGSPSSIRAASTSSAGSAWASDITDQPLSGSPASQGTHHHHGGADRRKRGDAAELAGAGQVSCDGVDGLVRCARVNLSCVYVCLGGGDDAKMTV